MNQQTAADLMGTDHYERRAVPTGLRPASSLAHPSRRARLRSVALGLATVAVLAAGAILAYSSVTTASARIAGNTSNDSSLLQAAAIELKTDGESGKAQSSFFIEAEGLYPGVVVERCLTLRYVGSLSSAAIVLSAQVRGGSGLDRYLDTNISVGQGQAVDCHDFVSTDEAFAATLLQLATSHPRYERGLKLAEATSDSPVAIRFRFQVPSDDRAQRLTTDVGLRFEVRP